MESVEVDERTFNRVKSCAGGTVLCKTQLSGAVTLKCAYRSLQCRVVHCRVKNVATGTPYEATLTTAL